MWGRGPLGYGPAEGHPSRNLCGLKEGCPRTGTAPSLQAALHAIRCGGAWEGSGLCPRQVTWGLHIGPDPWAFFWAAGGCWAGRGVI